MAFDRDLAAKGLRSDDRDIAPYFTGREAEIAAFDNAVAAAGDKPLALFRIFQGPPGCGKTSLAAHLAEIRARETVFVPCAMADLADGRALAARNENSTFARGPAAAIERAGLADEPEYRELPRTAFPTALIEKGIVTNAGGAWAVAIPSMVDWALMTSPSEGDAGHGSRGGSVR